MAEQKFGLVEKKEEKMKRKEIYDAASLNRIL